MTRPGNLSGAFARPPAIVAAPAILFAAYGWVVFATTFWAPGSVGIDYNAPGSDWMVLWGAAHEALHGHLPLIFDGDRFTAWLNQSLKGWLTAPVPFRPWVYPPSFLVLLAPFEPLGFLGSYAAFQALSAGLLVAAILYRSEQPRYAPWLAAAALLCPAASVNAVDGQCAFLVAALLIGGFRLAKTRPLLAGAVLGLLTFKPQFWLLVPVALAAAGQWRALAAAVGSGGALALASAAIFGIDAWVWWVRETLESFSGADPKWVQFGRIWGHSVYACAVLLGAPAKLASLVQTGAIAAGAAAVFAAFRSRLSGDLKLAALLAATLLAAPHSGSYDMVLMVIATGLWLTADGEPRPLWRWILALAVWQAAWPPVISPPARLLPLLMAAFILLILRRAYLPARLDAAALPA
ncbi:glycosyltransferase family 87 protein [Phenylobacterium sp.]|uniref:glycosyltransferase family 87 protein n=1 Tax=Phenylobacterium sp. TaxID=1871053 RepID=UPI001210568C|nr:glycosyltransferase family 87 protein [Phenylobacterium sp.]THD57910.1 MAG: DUF2029 domain-containing protein [Phenylobacterium sp.]